MRTGMRKGSSRLVAMLLCLVMLFGMLPMSALADEGTGTPPVQTEAPVSTPEAAPEGSPAPTAEASPEVSSTPAPETSPEVSPTPAPEASPEVSPPPRPARKFRWMRCLTSWRP